MLEQTRFNLLGFKNSEKKFADKLKIQGDIKTQAYKTNYDVEKRIDDNWGFAIKTFRY